MGIKTIETIRRIKLFFRDLCNVQAFVETGTYKAVTALWASSNFDQVYTIELSPDLYKQISLKYQNYANIIFLNGNSVEILPKIMAEISQPSLFWLDGHWSGIGTAGEENECPLLQEIEAINHFGYEKFIFIDDARLFLSPPPPPHNTNHWPTIAEIIKKIEQGVTDSYTVVYNDVIISIPLKYKDAFVRFLGKLNGLLTVAVKTYEPKICKPDSVDIRSEKIKWLMHDENVLGCLKNEGLWDRHSPLRLHLGCGENRLEGYINVDFPPTEHTIQTKSVPDIYADITKLRFPDQCVDEIRLHHVFEHFERTQALALLIQWHRWLKIGAKLHIETPDIIGCAEALVSDRPYADKQAVLRHAFGSQEARWANHLDGWYAEKFQYVLSRFGFLTQSQKNRRTTWPYLTDVETIAVKENHRNESELLNDAAEILKDYLVSDVSSEQRMHKVWCDQLRHQLKKSDVQSKLEESQHKAKAPSSERAETLHRDISNLIVVNDCPAADNLGYDNDQMTENGELDFVSNIIKPSDVVFDVGANKGDWCEMLLGVKPGVTIFAFEPVQCAFKTLRTRLNNANVKPYNKAVSSTDKEEIFYHYGQDKQVEEMSSFYRRSMVEKRLNIAPSPISVNCVSLDSFCSNHRIPKINFLKIDTEGSELDVLQGAKAMLRSGKIDVVQFEYNGTFLDAGISMSRIFEFLTGFGYRLFRIVPKGLIYISEWRNALETFRYSNYAAIATEPLTKSVNECLNDCGSNEAVCVIFSKDRAMQLDATISSLKLQCVDLKNIPVKVIYKISNMINKEQYNELQLAYPEVEFIPEKNFKQDLIATIRNYEFIVFLVDDNIFVRKFYIREFIDILKKQKNAVGFSLRLGKNTQYCYMLNRYQKLPEFKSITDEIIAFNWVHAECDFAYPLELSSSIYRVKEIMPLLKKLNYNNPNNLESLLYENRSIFSEKMNRLLCSITSIAFCNPINKVQNVCASNRSGNNQLHTPEKLSELFGEGYRIEVAKLASFIPNGCHQEVPLKMNKPDKNPIKVSVVIPCYNYGKYLREAVESVIEQKFLDLEIIVVNDGSTDNTKEVAEKLINEFSHYRIKVLNQENSGHPAIARNNGIAIAKGEYILPLDADDQIAMTMIERCVTVLNSNPVVDFVYTDRKDFDGIDQIVKARKYDFSVLKYQNHISYCAMFRKRVWENVGGYRVTGFEDWDFWIAAGALGHKGYYLPEPLFRYRRHDAGKYQKDLENEECYRAQLVLNNPLVYSRDEILGSATILKQQRLTNKPETVCPLVSVVVPTYNRPVLLEDAIRSICNQTYENIEVIVVNDAGKDISVVCDKFKDESILFIEHNRNKGLAAARNTGINAARGKYIAYLDDDDIFYPNHIETLVNVLENSEYKVAYSDSYRAHFMEENGILILKNKDLPYSIDFDPEKILIGNFVPVLCFMHERTCLDIIGLFDETLTSHEDWDLWIRMSLMYKFDHIRKVTAEFSWRTDGSTMTSGKSRDMVETLEKIYRKHRDQVKKKPHIAEAQRKHLEERKKTLCLSDSFPKCSIIIPVCNNLSLTGKCINELYKVTPNDLFEVIVVDNASNDGTKEYLKSLGDRIKVITNIENKGFAVACNKGAKLAKCEFLVFLNNDTVPVADWLETMVSCAENDDGIGIVGSKLLYPDGTIQHAGIEIINGIPDHPFRNAHSDTHEANILRELDMVTGACLLIKKEIFDKCNGFDENYQNGVEDVDLCLKVRELGFKVVYNPQSTLYHHEGKTPGRFDHVRENLALFFKRWGQRLDRNGKFIQHNTLEKARIIWEGSQFVNHSLALVNREMCRRLAKLVDIELSLVPYEPHQFDASADPVKYGTIDNLLNLRLSEPTDVHIRHQWPPNFKPPVEGHWVMIQPWEYGSLPKDWVKPMRNQIDELWVPSKYVREVCIESGIPDSKVFVIPNGVDYENFDPNAQPKPLDTAKSFKFLFVGGTIPRKGIDVLLDAYTSAFSRGDDVCLVIKDMGTDTFYRGQSGAERILAIQKREGEPEILYLKEDLTDKEMAGLYTACDCLVHPYRGEGFGLPVAEAMACGLPVVVTRGGACDDFCNENNSLLIESQRRPIIMNDPELCDTGWVLEPNRDDLIRLLRFLYENKDEGRKIGAVAAREIRESVSWEKSADLVVQRIKELTNKPIIRLQVNEGQKSSDNNYSELPLYTSIQERISNGDFEGAIAKLEDLVGSKPELAVACNDLGVLYHRQGKNALALTQYRRAVDLERGNTNFRKNLADLLVVTFEEYEEALQHYVAVLASDPKDVEALSATGHICARLERYDDAAEFYERVLEIEPNNSDAANWRAKMLERKYGNSLEGNLNDRYLALLSEIGHEDLSGAIQKVEKFIDMYPKHGQAHNDLGVLFYKNQSKAEVLAHYLKAVELEPENVTFRKNLADFLYVEEGRVEEALENYVEVLRIKPDDVATLLVSGHICTSIDRYEDAMGFYNKVLNIEPGNLDARKNLEVLERRQISMLYKEERDEEKTDGAAEINQAETQASVDELTIVKDGKDGVVEELINKADLLFQQERIDQAVDAMLKAIAVNQLDGRTYIELARQLINHGSNENALEVLAEMPANQLEALEKQKLVLEGYCQEGMGNYAAAKKCNDGVLAREPKNAMALNAKALNLNGILAYRNGDKETAEQHFKRAIELDSEYGEPHTNLGALVWENGKPKMALEHYERGFSISPTDIDVANAYHEAVAATGEYKRAEKAARSALKKYPQCRKVLYLLVDTLIRQEKNEEALKEMETALSTFGIDEGLLDTALAFRERVGKIKKTVSSKKPGVSLCMIVKDEEANLAHCLASVKPIVDEMIVVDTGSTDRTRDIAEFFGARIYDFEWKGNFAEARNFSLSKAKGGWILILDADEVISSKDYVKFQSIVRRRPKKPIAYSITTRNYCTLANTIGWETNLGEYPAEEAGFGWLPSTKVRLFYGRSRIRFEGAVHEMVDPALKRAGIQVKSCNIPVHHYGRLDADRMDRKGKIYYDIGRRKLEESNCDHAAVRELATQATILGKNEEAVDLWHRFLKMSPPDRAVAEAHINLATLYIRLQDYGAARNVSEKVLSKLPEMKEANYNLALSELYLGNAEKTVDVLKRLVEDHPLYPPAQFILAATCFINGQKEQAEALLENLKKGPFGLVLTRSFAELVRDLNGAGRFDYAQQLLDAALENKIVDAQILSQLSLTLPNSPQPVAVAG